MSFRAWKTRLMKKLIELYAETKDPVIQKTIEVLRYAKSRDMSTVLHELYLLVARGYEDLIEFVKTAPTEEAETDQP